MITVTDEDFEQVRISTAANCCAGCCFDSAVYQDDCHRPEGTSCSGADTILRPVTPEGVAYVARAKLGLLGVG